ncbi:protein GVQW3-like [Stegodyphus dumicola]|uniref:protein GVQW3-like n=1 Tax=Stegodyphus dumicola TaxID=202533 RepID=UPI0015AAC552|nr:protein GVQW3-like [Stegodyphus dumicola]
MKVSKAEQHGIVHFLTAEDVEGCEIHRQMKRIYGKYCMSWARVQEWHKHFREGHLLIGDDPRSGALKCVTEEHVAKVDELIKKNHHVRVGNISVSVGLSHGMAHNSLKFRKVPQWVPHRLTPE